MSAEANENFVFNLTMPNRLLYSTNIVKVESRTSNLFECSTETHPIFFKYSERWVQRQTKTLFSNLTMPNRILYSSSINKKIFYKPIYKLNTIARLYRQLSFKSLLTPQPTTKTNNMDLTSTNYSPKRFYIDYWYPPLSSIDPRKCVGKKGWFKSQNISL